MTPMQPLEGILVLDFSTLLPGIHVYSLGHGIKTWMAGTS